MHLIALVALVGCRSLGESRDLGTIPIPMADREAFTWELNQTVTELETRLREFRIPSELEEATRAEVRTRLGRIESVLVDLKEVQAELRGARWHEWRKAAARANSLVSQIDEEFERLDALLGPEVLWSLLQVYSIEMTRPLRSTEARAVGQGSSRSSEPPTS